MKMQDEKYTLKDNSALSLLGRYSNDIVAASTNLRKRLDEKIKAFDYPYLLEMAIPMMRNDGSFDKKYKKYAKLGRYLDKLRIYQGKLMPKHGLRINNTTALNILGKRINRRKLLEKDYRNSKKKYDEFLKNSLKKINEWWMPVGYKLSFSTKGYCELNCMLSNDVIAEKLASQLLS